MLTHSNLWINFNYACVAVAFFMLGMSLWLMDVNLATKGYLAMGIVFLSGSLVTLVKTLHEVRLQNLTTEQVARAKQEQLLAQYGSSMAAE